MIHLKNHIKIKTVSDGKGRIFKNNVNNNENQPFLINVDK